MYVLVTRSVQVAGIVMIHSNTHFHNTTMCILSIRSVQVAGVAIIHRHIHYHNNTMCVLSIGSVPVAGIVINHGSMTNHSLLTQMTLSVLECCSYRCCSNLWAALIALFLHHCHVHIKWQSDYNCPDEANPCPKGFRPAFEWSEVSGLVAPDLSHNIQHCPMGVSLGSILHTVG